MKKAGWIVVFALILGGIGTLFSFQATKSIEDEKLQVHKEEAFTASEIQDIHVDTSSADIQFVEGKSNQIEVTLSGYARKWKEYSYEVEEEEGELNVNLKKRKAMDLDFLLVLSEEMT